MQARRILTLLSDFGLQDSYVGVMKGVIAQINPDLIVIDLTHQIPPQQIAAARFTLMAAFADFPVGTVHVAVVDPGVGGQRRAIALALGTDPAQPRGVLVGPDNGLFSGVISQYPVLAAVELTNSYYWRISEPSQTFHGRDIFAPVGAHLASGVSLELLGPAIAPTSLVNLDLPLLQTESLEDGAIQLCGCIQAVDHFGNLVTNIPGAVVAGKPWCIRINDLSLSGRQTYSDVATGDLLALVGSHGWVEIALNGGNAQTRLKLDWGASVQIIFKMHHSYDTTD